MLYKLAKIGIKGNMLRWIEEFLQNRTFQVLIGNTKSETITMTNGLPQGSTLSPTLFNVMMADIPHPLRIYIYEYADDIAIAITADDIQEAIRKIEEWAATWNLQFIQNKCKAMNFTK